MNVSNLTIIIFYSMIEPSLRGKSKMENKERQEKYDNRKYMITSIGIGSMVGNAAFGIWDYVNHSFDCSTPVIIIGTVAFVATGFALLKDNPYKNKEVIKEEAKTKKLEK